MSMPKQDITKITLVDKTYDLIKEDVLSGELAPGSKIDIKELCNRFNVSPTPLKIALNRLVEDNLLINNPRKGMFVKEFDLSEMLELCDLRLMFDLFYVEEIITTLQFNSDLRNRLQENIIKSREFVNSLPEEADLEMYLKNYQYDYEFHELFLVCTGNKKLVEVYHKINPFHYSVFIFNRQSLSKLELQVDEHEAILEAALKGDVELLKDQLKHHYENIKTAISLVVKIKQMEW